MPYKDKNKQREFQRKWKAKKRIENLETGICVNCTKKAMFGHTRCKKCTDSHRKFQAQYNIKYRKENLENGVCYYCGKTVFDEHLRICPLCYERKQRCSLWNL